MKRVLAFVLAIIVAAGIYGCGGNKNAKPASKIKGYYTAEQTYRGGKEATDINVKDISVAVKDGTTSVTFTFVKGSNSQAGIPEADISFIPEYTVSCLQGVDRVVLTLKGISYWDYKNKGNWTNELLKGIFYQPQVGENGNAYIYLQLSSEPVFQCQENKNKLTINLKNSGVKESEAFYVTANAYYEYKEGRIDTGIGMMPVLCNDLSSILLISEAFDKQADADYYAENITNQLSQIGDFKISVVKLKPGEFPAYDESVDIEMLRNREIISRDGKTEKGELLFIDARLLKISPDSSFALFAKPKYAGDHDIGFIPDVLWTIDNNGARNQLSGYEFASVGGVSISPDGKKIAIIEQFEQDNPLSVLFIGQDKVVTIGQQGMGSFTSGSAWNSIGTSLYAMAGNEELQFKRYDINAQGSSAVKVLLERPGFESRLESFGDKIYFVDGYDSSYKIIAYDTGSNDIEEIADGHNFTLSPDGKYMAILVQKEGQDFELEYDLYLMNIQNNEKTLVSKSAIISSFFFGRDNTLFYSIDRGDTDYPVEVLRYRLADKTVDSLFRMQDGDVMPYMDANKLALVLMYQKKDDYSPVTYLVNID